LAVFIVVPATKLSLLQDSRFEAGHEPALDAAPEGPAAAVMQPVCAGAKTGFPPRRGIIVAPWDRLALARVAIVDDRRYETHGSTEISFPTL
jgi:hypothetical protein